MCVCVIVVGQAREVLDHSMGTSALPWPPGAASLASTRQLHGALKQNWRKGRTSSPSSPLTILPLRTSTPCFCHSSDAVTPLAAQRLLGRVHAADVVHDAAPERRCHSAGSSTKRRASAGSAAATTVWSVKV